MSAVKALLQGDCLDDKFFNLVARTPDLFDQSKSDKNKGAKVPSGVEKRSKRVDKEKPVPIRLRGKKNQDKNKEKQVIPKPVVESKLSPLEVLVTPNPSATILQCRVESEVKDAEQNALLMKLMLKEFQNDEKLLYDDQSDNEPLTKVPQVLELGLAGVFELIQETMHSHKSLCCKALKALLNMLQGLTLNSMRKESQKILEKLFDILLALAEMRFDTKEANQVFTDGNIPSLASSCLLSLACAWGKTGKLLSVIMSFIVESTNQQDGLPIKVPTIFINLQHSVMAATLRLSYLPSPLQIGINQSCLYQSWNISLNDSKSESELISLQCDGTYLYALYADSSLLKIGTGYNLTEQGIVYCQNKLVDLQGSSKMNINLPTQLFYFNGSMFVLTSDECLYMIDKTTLTVTLFCHLNMPGEVWFCYREGLCSITPGVQEKMYQMNFFKASDKGLSSRKPSVVVNPTKKHLFMIGKVFAFDPVHNNSQDEEIEWQHVTLGKDFSLSRNKKGQVFYAGKPESLGLNKSRCKKVPEILPLPNLSSKIVCCSAAPDGGHGLLVASSGEVYFIGTSRRGEDGEAIIKNRRQPAPQKAKVMKCVGGKHVVKSCCNVGTSALITDDGKLYLFGKDSTQADAKTGLVSSLSDVHVDQVGLGKAHVVVLSRDGRVWTAGVNNKGQCGRIQEGVLPIAQRIAEVELEKDVSMPEDKSMDDIPFAGMSGSLDIASVAPVCSPDKHKWHKEVCMICAVCLECTGYGSNCVNYSSGDRVPRTPCGCGAGWSGCEECGCCRTCAGEADIVNEEDGKRKDRERFPFLDLDFPPGADPSSPILNKLAVFFQVKKSKPNDKENKAPSKSDILKEANKMALLPLLQIKFATDGKCKPIQISCGAHHTLVLMDNGSVFVFGQNCQGQLGLGDTVNRNQPVLCPLNAKIKQVSAGSLHSLFLTDEGLVYGCGNNRLGQLGQSAMVDHLSPILVLKFQEVGSNYPRALWINACQTTSFIKYEEVLLDVAQLKKAKIFGNTQFVGIHYTLNNNRFDQSANESDSNLLFIDIQKATCKHFSSSGNIRINADEQVCLDASHDILWSFKPDEMKVSSYMLCGYKTNHMDNHLPFSPQLAVSLCAGEIITRKQAGLNLLSCLNSLVTECPNGMNGTDKDGTADGNSLSSPNTSTQTSESQPHAVDEYNTVNRFKSHGGGWGYSVHSIEAIRFMADQDIMLGGVGVFGGRGEYSVVVCVYEDVGETEVQGEGELLAETEKTSYECGFREKYHSTFEEPIPVSGGHWYTVTAKVCGPSSDCGSHGEQTVLTNDNIKFSFRRSKRSNNGTDVSAGQIPELLYCLPKINPPAEVKPEVLSQEMSVQILPKTFYMSFSEESFESLTYLIEWTRTLLFTKLGENPGPRHKISQHGSFVEDEHSVSIPHLCYVFTACLHLLRVTNVQNSGKNSTAYNLRCIGFIEAVLTDGGLDSALSDASPNYDQELLPSFYSVVCECHHIIMDCMNVLHSTPPRRWDFLNQVLERYNAANEEDKPHKARMLVCVLDSLSQPSFNFVDCLPLFPRTYSNLTSIASAAQSPSLDKLSCSSTPSTPHTGGFYEVTLMLVEIICQPARSIVSVDIPPKINNVSGYADFSISLLLTPQESLVESTCKLLASLTSDLAYRASDPKFLLCGNSKMNGNNLTNRFEQVPCGDSGSAEGLYFSVDRDGINIMGMGVCGTGKGSHKYEVEVMKLKKDLDDGENWKTVDIVKAESNIDDSHHDSNQVTHIKFNKMVAIKKNEVYKALLLHDGEKCYTLHDQGKITSQGSDGTLFDFTHNLTFSSKPAAIKSQIYSILYQRLADELPTSPTNKWIGTATTPSSAAQTYQHHVLNILSYVVECAVEIFHSVSKKNLASKVKGEGSDNDKPANSEKANASNSPDVITCEHDNKEAIHIMARKVLNSHLISFLLPELFSNIGVLIRKNPLCAVDVMDLIRDLLHPLINIQQIAYPNIEDKSAKCHSMVVESNHPYTPATVKQYKATFPASVKWMVVNFSPKCQTVQLEDFLQLFLVQSKPQEAGENGDIETNRSNAKEKNFFPILKKMHEDRNWPQNSLLLPGCQLLFSLETASDYTNSKEQKPYAFYGFKCTVTGYESLSLASNHDGSRLVSKLINIAGMCSVNLMNIHHELWIDENMEENQNALSGGHDEKTDQLKAIEKNAMSTLQRHSELFMPGLQLNRFPAAKQALEDNLDLNEVTKEKKFLMDFVGACPNTSGGRLARWLQPDSYVDPSQCVLQLNKKSLIHTLPTAITITTKDQYGNVVQVPTLKVDLSAKPQSSGHANSVVARTGDAGSDVSPMEPVPNFSCSYDTIKHKDYRYHSITMMRAYRNFSFEELRFSYPLKRTLKTENILVASVGNGVYNASWIPSHATDYILQVTFDDELRGPRDLVKVEEAPQGYSEMQMLPASSMRSKYLKFNTKNSRGLRIRTNPTLQSPEIVLLEYGSIIEYVDEVRNNDGNWVKLSETSVAEYCKNSANSSEAWCISFHKHSGRTHLVPVDNPAELSKQIDARSGGLEARQSISVNPLASFKSFVKEIPKKKMAAASLPSNSFSTPAKLFTFSSDDKTETSTSEWKQIIPGSYKVEKCGSAGHNIRFNPDLKSTPVGKICEGRVFIATNCVKNKFGSWLLLHSSDVQRFCEESVDIGHGWTLALSSDGTQHLNFTELTQPKPIPPRPTQPVFNNTNINNIQKSGLFSKQRSSPRGDACAKISSPFIGNPFNSFGQENVDLLVESDLSVGIEPKAMELKTEASVRLPVEGKTLVDDMKRLIAEKSSHWNERVKKHQRSSSDSDILRKRYSKSQSGENNSAKRFPGSSLRHRRNQSPLSTSSPPNRTRSMSTNSKHPRPKSEPQPEKLTKKSESQKSNPSKLDSSIKNYITDRSSQSQSRSKKLNDTQKLKKSADVEQSGEPAFPVDKVIRGRGKKKSMVDSKEGVILNGDIPFIDDAGDDIFNIIDIEGNILSPGKPCVENGVDLNRVDDASAEKSISVDHANVMLGSKPQPAKKTYVKQIDRKPSGKISTNKSLEALSPLVAECSRAVFAAFVWHEGIVHDAMSCSSYIKFENQHLQLDEPTVKLTECNINEMPNKSMPETLAHLSILWNKLSEPITKIAISNETLPTQPLITPNLNCQLEKLPTKPPQRKLSANDINAAAQIASKIPMKKMKHEKNPILRCLSLGRGNLGFSPYQQQQQKQKQKKQDGESGEYFRDTKCELCDQVFPYPVTYHMSMAHPGCGLYAGGLGYNSSGHYCGGWAGECGDGGNGGSTWYLLCVVCRTKYKANKNGKPGEKQDSKKQGSWMNRLKKNSFQHCNARQTMRANAMFLLSLRSTASVKSPQMGPSLPGLFASNRFWNVDLFTDEDAMWEKEDLLPQSNYSDCPFSSISCAFLNKRGHSDESMRDVSAAQQIRKLKAAFDNRQKSLSSQNTPSSTFKNIVQRLSITPDSSPQKTESIILQHRLLRSISAGSPASKTQRKRACSSGDVATFANDSKNETFFLHSSATMRRLATSDLRRSEVISFITERHDLNSIQLTLQITLKRAALRVYVLQALTWLLRTVIFESCIHDILWYFVTALSADHHRNDARNEKSLDENCKDGKDGNDEEIESLQELCEHPVKGMEIAGMDSMKPLVEAYHGFLQTVSNIMMHLPANSPVQLMAIRCWSVRVHSSDHTFLQKSKVFSHISAMLSNSEVSKQERPKKKYTKVKYSKKSNRESEISVEEARVECEEDLSLKVHIKTSSHEAVANSLTDGSTETFWESGEDDRNRIKAITIDFLSDKDGQKKNEADVVVEQLFVHIDNTRDLHKRTTSISLYSETEEGDWNKLTLKDISNQFAGWIFFNIAKDIEKIKMGLKGPDNSLRVRQIKLLGQSMKGGYKLLKQVPAEVMRAQICEAELLNTFKLLTAEVFGQLLSENPENKNLNDVTTAEAHSSSSVMSSPASPRDVNLREHMVGILFSRDKLTYLQKKVFEHTVHAIETETLQIKTMWKNSLNTENDGIQQVKPLPSDTYCFELMSMMLALSGSDVGCHYIAQQNTLIIDIFTLLHTGTPRIQRQVTLLLRRILSDLTPARLALILNATVPTQDKLVHSEASSCSQSDSSTETTPTNDTPTSNSTFGVLDPLFACIAKSLAVQVKGIGSQQHAGDGVNTENSKNKKMLQVKMETVSVKLPEDDSSMWWLCGSMKDQTIVEATIKLLTDMSTGKINAAWATTTKCAVSETILSFTRLSEVERDPTKCLHNPTLWLTLASLCILDHDHVDKLSSAKSIQTTNKTHVNDQKLPCFATEASSHLCCYYAELLFERLSDLKYGNGT